MQQELITYKPLFPNYIPIKEPKERVTSMEIQSDKFKKEKKRRIFNVNPLIFLPYLEIWGLC